MKMTKCYKNRVPYDGGHLCCLILEYEVDKSTALQLIDEQGYPYATATVYSPETKYEVKNYDKRKHVAIKNYMENSGIDIALTQAGILKKQVGRITSGFVTIPIYELNTNPDDIMEIRI